MRSYLHVFVVCAVMLSACGGNQSPSAPTPPVDPTLLRIVTTTLPAGSQFASYSARLEATGGHTPFIWTVDGLPSGFSATPDGTITGMFANPGNWPITVKVTDSANASDTKSIQLTGGYEAVPTEKHYLLAADGTPTHMWWRLLAEPVPARGAAIVLGPGACPNGCFHNFSVEYGLDTMPNPNTGTTCWVGWSQDGQTISTILDACGVKSGSSARTDTGRIWMFTEKPKYVVLTGTFRGDTNGSYGTFPGETGVGTILLDYK